MNEKSIVPIHSFSAYTPPFNYNAFVDLQVNFSKMCKNRLVTRKLNTTEHTEVKILSCSLDQTTIDIGKTIKKPVQQREFIFGADHDEIPHGKTTLVHKPKHRKGLSLIETIAKVQGEVPDLVIFTSPTKVVNRFVSPYIKEPKNSPKSLKEIKKPVQSKKVVNLPLLFEDDSVKLREFVFDYFLKTLRMSNGIQFRSNELKIYKFFVGSGNNSELVVKIIRSRPWWVRTESSREASFVWTSVKHNKTLRRLPSGPETQTCSISFSPKKLPVKKAQELERQGYNSVIKSKSFLFLQPQAPLDMAVLKLHNRLLNNKHLVSKKRLFMNLKNYYEGKNLHPFNILPLTFHVKNGKNDENFLSFKAAYKEILEKNDEKLWIVKPGENTNRGKGIKVCSSVEDVFDIVSYPKENRTYVIQKYIEKPLLINKRKFDIRCFGLVTSFNNNIQGYFYPEGYIRTASKEFSLKNCNKFIHLTNDAVQKNSEEYGKFEPGNKLNYGELQQYLNQESPNLKFNFEKQINSQIRTIVAETFEATASILDPHRKLHTFELLGYDFMVDSNFHVWLIEVNTNPCLELGCSYLSKLIPNVLNNTFKLTLDQIFCPNVDAKKFQKWIPDSDIKNKFELVFSEQQPFVNN